MLCLSRERGERRLQVTKCDSPLSSLTSLETQFSADRSTIISNESPCCPSPEWVRIFTFIRPDQIRPPQCSFESRIIHASNRFHLALDMWAWRNYQSLVWTVELWCGVSSLHFKTFNYLFNRRRVLVLGLLKYNQPPRPPLIALRGYLV